jgi:hypothetical protein
MCQTLFRGSKSKASMAGMCPDTGDAGTGYWIMKRLAIKAELQKIAIRGMILAFFDWIHLAIRRLQAFQNPLSQVFDFSQVGPIVHVFAPIFALRFRRNMLDWNNLSK